MGAWIRSEIRSMVATFPGEPPPGMIRLDTMEPPFLLSETVRKELSEKLSSIPLNRYPDPSAKELVGLLSRIWGIPSGRILLGNGSDEILLNLFLAADGPVICPVPSFSMYEVIARTAGKHYIPVDMNPDLSLDIPAIERVVSRETRPGMVVVSSPNNPTGAVLPLEDLVRLRTFLKGRGFALLVDEAYFPYQEGGCLEQVGEEPDFLVLRSFSKMGLAALRLGVLLAPEGVVREVLKLRLPYNLNALTQSAGLFLLEEHLEDLKEHVRQVVDLRESLARDLSLVPGLFVYPSRTNFLLVRFWRGTGQKIFENLFNDGILVRDVSSHHPVLSDCLRISVGSPEENRLLVDRLRTFSERVNP